MLHIPNIDFVAINFSEYFKFIKKQQNLRTVAEWIYIFLITLDIMESNSFIHYFVHHYKVEILNICEAELQLINTKTVIETN